MFAAMVLTHVVAILRRIVTSIASHAAIHVDVLSLLCFRRSLAKALCMCSSVGAQSPCMSRMRRRMLSLASLLLHCHLVWKCRETMSSHVFLSVTRLSVALLALARFELRSWRGSPLVLGLLSWEVLLDGLVLRVLCVDGLVLRSWRGRCVCAASSWEVVGAGDDAGRVFVVGLALCIWDVCMVLGLVAAVIDGLEV